MNYNKIETLKQLLTNMAMQRVRIKNDDFNVDGQIIGVGFKPYWSDPHDTKIEKLEINILDNCGRVRPFYFYHVLNYEVVSFDTKDLRSAKNISLDIRVYMPGDAGINARDTIRINMSS